jgi:hypothetical protein
MRAYVPEEAWLLPIEPRREAPSHSAPFSVVFATYGWASMIPPMAALNWAHAGKD